MLWTLAMNQVADGPHSVVANLLIDLFSQKLNFLILRKIRKIFRPTVGFPPILDTWQEGKKFSNFLAHACICVFLRINFLP